MDIPKFQNQNRIRPHGAFFRSSFLAASDYANPTPYFQSSSRPRWKCRKLWNRGILEFIHIYIYILLLLSLFLYINQALTNPVFPTYPQSPIPIFIPGPTAFYIYRPLPPKIAPAQHFFVNYCGILYLCYNGGEGRENSLSPPSSNDSGSPELHSVPLS